MSKMDLREMWELISSNGEIAIIEAFDHFMCQFNEKSLKIKPSDADSIINYAGLNSFYSFKRFMTPSNTRAQIKFLANDADKLV